MLSSARGPRRGIRMKGRRYTWYLMVGRVGDEYEGCEAGLSVKQRCPRQYWKDPCCLVFTNLKVVEVLPRNVRLACLKARHD